MEDREYLTALAMASRGEIGAGWTQETGLKNPIINRNIREGEKRSL